MSERPPAQPPGASPAQWVPRTDTVSRKVIERLDRVTEELELVQRTLAQHVTFGWLVGILGGAAVVIFGAVWTITKDARAEMLAAKASIADDVRQVRTEMAGKQTATETQVGAIYKILVEGKSRSQVRADTEASK